MTPSMTEDKRHDSRQANDSPPEMAAIVHYMVISRDKPKQLVYPSESKGHIGSLYLVDRPGQTEPRQQYFIHTVKGDDIIVLKAERTDKDGRIYYLAAAPGSGTLMFEAKAMAAIPYGGAHQPAIGLAAHHSLQPTNHQALEKAAQDLGLYVVGYSPMIDATPEAEPGPGTCGI